MKVNLVKFVDDHDVQKNKCFDIIYIVCKFKFTYISYIRYNSI